MKCSKLLKEAFEGINLTYKLNDVINEIPANQKFNTRQMVGYLTSPKRGVSPKEIKASGLDTWFKGDYPVEASEWQKKLQNAPHQFTETDLGSSQYRGITLGEKGKGNPTYKETIMQGQRFEKSPTNISHYREFEAPGKSLLGWRRTHVDEINGKPSTVLNEFQSDWAQTERKDAGTFESNYVSPREKDISRMTKHEGLSPEQVTKEILDSWEASGYIAGPNNPGGEGVIADFPMTEKKFHQFQIVGAIDEAIKNGTKRVVIPIERENELAGSKGVTKFYDSLNIKILPEIRKKLEAQGMKLNVHKEGYGLPGFKKFGEFTEGETVELIEQFASLNGGLDAELEESLFQYLYRSEPLPDSTTQRAVDLFLTKVEIPSVPRTLHVIDIEEIPNKPVKWDVYSTLGAIGLGSMAEKLKEQEKEQ